MKRLTLMLRADDTARADIALTPDRTYYRFATDSSIEDGELGPVGGDFDCVAAGLLEASAAREGEKPLDADMRVQIFEDNRLLPTPVSEESVGRLADALAALAPEFTFVQGFKG